MSIPLIDGHLDIAPLALHADRDMTLPVADLRRRDALLEHTRWETAAVSLPAMRDAHIPLCMPSLFVRAKSPEDELQMRTRTPRDYSDRSIAYAEAQGQIAYYRLLEAQGQLRIIHNRTELAEHWRDVETQQPEAGIVVPGEETTPPPIGAVIMMEGCDPIITPHQAAIWFAHGVRIASLVHMGHNGYAVGNGDEGPLTQQGRDLLTQFDQLGMILDLSHLCDISFYEAIEQFKGRVIATHSNCRKLVTGNRQLTDEQIRAIIDRDGVIGTVCFNRFLAEHWKIDNTRKESVTLSVMADHIDHICQIAGDAQHAAIGSDLDGGFGTESIPAEMDTIADFPKLAPILADRGYSDNDIASIFHKNWLRLLGEALPE